jgi:long-subunit fatty acid transport protein
MRVWVAGLFIIACLGTFGGGTARAGGVEYAGAGTQALGRGGAVAARADDPMVLMYNPAGLVELRGTQLMLNANLALMNACVDPIGYYGWSVYNGGMASRFVDPANPNNTLELGLGRQTPAGSPEQAYYEGAYDTVCMKQGLTPVPQVGITARLSERFGIGIGMMFPSVTPQGTWGSNSGIIQGAGGLRPAATRYMMTNSGTVGMFPTIGAAYKIAEWLRIGASFRWGVINVDNTSIAGLQVGATPANDLLVRVRGTDWFVPEFTASVHIVPTDAIDFVAGFHYQDDLNAPGTIDITSGAYNPLQLPHTVTNQVTGVKQKFPMSTWGALRYASRLAPRPSGDGNDDLKVTGGRTVQDAFQNERFDIELDVQYEMNARHRDLTVDYLPNQVAEFESVDHAVTTQAFPDPSMPNTVIPKHWKDQVSVRLGGSYNIVPGVFGISAGAHYENRGVDPSYMQIDYWPLERYGVHAGVRFRIASSIDVMFSYAHIFQETLIVGAPKHENFDVIGAQYVATKTVSNIDKRTGPRGTADMPQLPREEPNPTVGAGEARLTQNFSKALPGTPPAIINAGTYRSGIDVLSAGVNMHF